MASNADQYRPPRINIDLVFSITITINYNQPLWGLKTVEEAKCHKKKGRVEGHWSWTEGSSAQCSALCARLPHPSHARHCSAQCSHCSSQCSHCGLRSSAALADTRHCSTCSHPHTHLCRPSIVFFHLSTIGMSATSFNEIFF